MGLLAFSRFKPPFACAPNHFFSITAAVVPNKVVQKRLNVPYTDFKGWWPKNQEGKWQIRISALVLWQTLKCLDTTPCTLTALWNVLNNSNSVLKVCIVTISDHFSSSHSLYLSISLRLPLTGMGCFLQYVSRPYCARPMRFGSSGPKDFFSDTSPKCIDRDRTGKTLYRD